MIKKLLNETRTLFQPDHPRPLLCAIFENQRNFIPISASAAVGFSPILSGHNFFAGDWQWLFTGSCIVVSIILIALNFLHFNINVFEQICDKLALFTTETRISGREVKEHIAPTARNRWRIALVSFFYFIFCLEWVAISWSIIKKIS